MNFNNNMERGVGKQERDLDRAQQNSMHLDEVAKGYASQVEKIFTLPAAPAIRNELQKYLAEADAEGPTQEEMLDKVLKSLEPFKAILKDVSEDSYERRAFAKALLDREKSLH